MSDNKKNKKENNIKKENKSSNKKLLEEIEKEKKQLEEDLKKMKEILANTQAQYIDLKKDFDMYIERVKRDEEKLKDDLFVNIVKWMVPFLEQLRISVENIPQDLKNNKWVEGVKMVYDNIVKYLNSQWIFIEDSVGCDIDFEKHEPIGYEEVEDEKKHKVLKEHSKVYLYKKDWKEIIICPAKVIVWK